MEGINFDGQQVSIPLDLDKLRETGIFLGLPMYGGQCFGSHAASLMKLEALCAQIGIPLQTEFLFNESLVQRARNYLVDKFLQSNMTRFVFLDSDIDFRPTDLLSLVHLQNINPDLDVICAPYAKKAIAWEKIRSAVQRGVADEDPKILDNFVGDFVFNALNAGSHSIGEPLEVLESGTGYMCIRREVFERFKEAHPEQEYVPDHKRSADHDGSRKIHAFFDCIIDTGVAPQKKNALVDMILKGDTDPKTLKKKAQEIKKIEERSSRRYLSEDYFFCQRVRALGMKVWLAPWISAGHNGFYRFGGSLSALGFIDADPTSGDVKK